MSEALTLRKGVQIAKALDLENCCFESGNSTLVKVAYRKTCCPNWKCIAILDDIISVSSSISGCCFKWSPRSANLTANCLINLSDTSMGPFG